MPWITLPGVTGKVYAPNDTGAMPKKHPCSTCFACQWCDEGRCRVCRSDRESRSDTAKRACCRHQSIGRTEPNTP